MGVALGTAVSKQQLQVQNCNTYGATIPHPKIVHDFYHSAGKQINFQDTLCCNDAELHQTEDTGSYAFNIHVNQSPEGVLQNLKSIYKLRCYYIQ